MFKLRFLEVYERFLYNVGGPFLRSVGQGLNRFGLSVQGSLATDDRLVPSLRYKTVGGNSPQIDRVNFLAPNSAIIGQVILGEQSSVWYGATLRGDLNEINIGKNSVIQDLVTLSPRTKNSLKVGDNVYIGPNASLESCTVENNAFIGMGASVHNGATVQSYGIVAAGSVIPEGTTVPSYQIWAGNPARYLRDLTNEEKEVLDEFHDEMQSLAKIHNEETEKSFRQIIDDRDQIAEEEHWEPEEFALKKLQELGFPMEEPDENYIEQRVLLKQPVKPEEQYWKKHYDPYEQDLYNFPDSFKIYGENYGKYEEIKKYFEENPEAEVRTINRDLKKKPTDESPWTRKF